MQLLNPIALWALAGLTVPIAIHLLSRKEGKVIKVGSLRHLQETNTQQFKGVKLNELVLLALRCLMLVFFVLLMSGLVIQQTKKSETKWVLVEHGLEKHPDVNPQLEKFHDDGYEVRWLSINFPLLRDSTSVLQHVHYQKLLKSLHAQNISEAIVLASNKVSGFAGLRTSLPPNVRWISVSTSPKEFTLKTKQFRDSVAVRTGSSSSEKTFYTSKNMPHTAWHKPTNTVDTLKIILVTDNTHLHDQKIIVAALKAIEGALPVNIKIQNKVIEDNNGNSSDWYIWLSDKPINLVDSMKVLYMKPTQTNKLLLQTEKNKWAITSRLGEEVALKNNLTLQLASLLIPSQNEWEIASQHDVRMMPDFIAWSNPVSKAQSMSMPATLADAYLIALFLLTFSIERLLAYHRNQ